ncbi:unnamed protein product [Adineta ricciae]|uniref:RecF/RecN/SMC N-terminal domain-containing protein n=1 Tax=Adineta ricciae TaxID=249248 RepID=A0A815QX28_ADIRI|nr:unnamed protein product [Adineta ricciae]
MDSLSIADMNNNAVSHSKKAKSTPVNETKKLFIVGQIKQLHLLNFMCHKNFSIEFHPTHLQLISGANGSGKSTIANAIGLCLGAQARSTGRTTNIQSFIRQGETSAQITITLANEGPEAYKPHLYGEEIQIVRKIGLRQSSYTILNVNGDIISRHKSDIEEILQALSISPANPLCILHQDIAKTFLVHSDSKKKFQFYMNVSQLDQMKQAYEQSIYTVDLLVQCVDAMKEKHRNMLTALEPLEQQVKRIELRRDYEEKRSVLSRELKSVRNDKIRQKIFELQQKLDETQTGKNEIDIEINKKTKEMNAINQNLKLYSTEKNDLEQDMHGLEQLIVHLSKQKHHTQCLVHSFSLDCENYRQILTEIELKQIYLQKQIDQCEDQRHVQIEEELSVRQKNQFQYQQSILKLIEDRDQSDNEIHSQQSTLHFLRNELQEKQRDLKLLIQITQDKMNAYGLWMSDCLKEIENDQRFCTKPIGPIGHYIQCLDPYWIYSVEKHLTSIMSAFICSSSTDEQILLEIFSSYTSDNRPPIYVRTFSVQTPDISSTLGHVRRANLLSIYNVLKIDHPIVESVLIDFRQIESTILVENIDEVRRIRQDGSLNWHEVDQRVKRVVEAWTHDGTNIKLNETFRVDENEKQPVKYLSTDSEQSVSIEELQKDIDYFHEHIQEMNESLDRMKLNRQTTVDQLDEMTKTSADNGNKISELKQKLDYLNSVLLLAPDCSLEELREESQQHHAIYTDNIEKYDRIKEQYDENRQHLLHITESYANVTKKLEMKTYQYNLITEHYEVEQTNRDDLQRRLENLNKTVVRLNENILQFEAKLKRLTKQRSKKVQETNCVLRSIHEIEHEINAITTFLTANEDTKEERQNIINQYRTRRDAARQYKQTYERCYRQIEYLRQFVTKRQDNFLAIANRHEYYLQSQFQRLMEKYGFDDCGIKIDHKKEELEILIKKSQPDLTSFSGGERSISTFCFLLALCQSVYLPFQLFDEIDIYMDNENLSSSLRILYENTRHYSTSQHIVFTPQAIDSQLWAQLGVPMTHMPTPKRSCES